MAKIFKECPSCRGIYGKYRDERVSVQSCNRCNETYCWICNDYSNMHKCSDGNVSDSSQYLGYIKSLDEEQSYVSSNYEYSNMVEISIQFDGAWMAIDTKVKIFINEIELGKGSFKNGFSFKHRTNKGMHKLKVKVPLRSSKIKFDTMDFNKYIIKLKYNRITGGWNSETFGIE